MSGATKTPHYIIKIDGEEFIKADGDYFDGLETFRKAQEKEEYQLIEFLVYRPMFGDYVRQGQDFQGGC